MTERHHESQKTHLIVALAQGTSAAKWARTYGVPKATAYRWSKEPAVRSQIESIRRRAIDRAEHGRVDPARIVGAPGTREPVQVDREDDEFAGVVSIVAVGRGDHLGGTGRAVDERFVVERRRTERGRIGGGPR